MLSRFDSRCDGRTDRQADRSTTVTDRACIPCRCRAAAQ